MPLALLFSCSNHENKSNTGKSLSSVLDTYWEERMQLYPLEATAKGDYRYNDKLTITIAESFRDSAIGVEEPHNAGALAAPKPYTYHTE